MKILEQSNGYTLFADSGFFVQGPVGKCVKYVDEDAARFTYAVAVALAADPPPVRDGSLHPGQGRRCANGQEEDCGGELETSDGRVLCDVHADAFEASRFLHER